jgi:hypothetical protein
VLTTTPTGRSAVPGTYHVHESHHGFCVVCGSVWPCSRAGRTKPCHPAPIPRADALG